MQYEVGVSILTDKIRCVYGPFPYGSYPDQRVFGLPLSKMLSEHECVIADGGYSGPHILKPGVGLEADVQYFRARHEGLHGRLKAFNVLKHVLRHNRSLHALCFHACTQLVQLRLLHGEKFFVS